MPLDGIIVTFLISGHPIEFMLHSQNSTTASWNAKLVFSACLTHRLYIKRFNLNYGLYFVSHLNFCQQIHKYLLFLSLPLYAVLSFLTF